MDPIASLDEYKFFRSRYPLGDKNETALLFLSDATIRRWCSPRWRIASARRTFTAAALAELTAANVKPLVAGNVQPGPIHTDLALVDAGELRLTSSGVSSSTQGTLEWMTPIVELPIEKVTKAEAEAYNQWHNNYHRNWRWVFDPIALRIGVNSDKLSGDLTVMPLIAASEYNEFISISRGRKSNPIPATRTRHWHTFFGDQHEVGADTAVGQHGNRLRATSADRTIWLAGLFGGAVCG